MGAPHAPFSSIFLVPFLDTDTCGSSSLRAPPPCAARRGKEKERRRPSGLGTVMQTKGEPERERADIAPATSGRLAVDLYAPEGSGASV